MRVDLRGTVLTAEDLRRLVAGGRKFLAGFLSRALTVDYGDDVIDGQVRVGLFSHS